MRVSGWKNNSSRFALSLAVLWRRKNCKMFIRLNLTLSWSFVINVTQKAPRNFKTGFSLHGSRRNKKSMEKFCVKSFLNFALRNLLFQAQWNVIRLMWGGNGFSKEKLFRFYYEVYFQQNKRKLKKVQNEFPIHVSGEGENVFEFENNAEAATCERDCAKQSSIICRLFIMPMREFEKSTQ